MACLYSEVRYGINMDVIITYVSVNPRVSHNETCLRRRVAMAFPDLSLHAEHVLRLEIMVVPW